MLMNRNEDMPLPAVVGVDIGGTKIAAGIVTHAGEILHEERTPTPSQQGAMAILDAVVGLCHSLIALGKSEGRQIHSIGVGAGGQIDIKNGRVRYASSVIPGWQGAEIVRVLEEKLCLPVRADNDVNVLALGEHRFGAARPYENVLFVGVGTGIGGALILNRQLVHGVSYAAGDIAHLLVDYRGDRVCGCGQTGHLEAYASGPAIAAHYSQIAGLQMVCELPLVLQRAQQGDPLAVAAIAEGASILGKALCGLLAFFDPQALVIGGGVTQLGNLWWQSLLAEIRSFPLPEFSHLPVHMAGLGSHAAVVGAGALVIPPQNSDT